jgi:hypothetical protein
MYELRWRLATIMTGAVFVILVVWANLHHAGIDIPVGVVEIAIAASIPVSFYVAVWWWSNRDSDDDI